ncbi:hypothetical protein [Mesorhizobium sp. KR1-2]|uniref:hypothetical protein n=1 Tax=Mesorhizobium sp. KR1-2 TaxID=3156609 RepID=UPI0032B60255
MQNRHTETRLGAKIDRLAAQPQPIPDMLREGREACNVRLKSLPAVISEPGTYCLSTTINVAEAGRDAITIKSNDVVIDGLGHTVVGSADPATTTRGLYAVDYRGITVKNIRFSGFNTAILIGRTDELIAETTTYPANARSRDIRISGVVVDGAAFQGIHVRADNFTIAGNTIMRIGPSTVAPHAFATGISTRGNGCEISGNRIMLGEPTGNGENVGIANYLGAGCRIERNTIVFDRLPEFGRNFGIWTRPSGGAVPLVADNLISGAHYALGPHGMFERNHIDNAVCAVFTRRPSDVDGFFDLGGNVAVRTAGIVRPGSRECPDEIERALSRYREKPSPEAAYLVALSYGEHSPIENEADSMAWLIVAAKSGHRLAANQIRGWRPPEIKAAAEKIAARILEAGTPAVAAGAGPEISSDQ